MSVLGRIKELGAQDNTDFQGPNFESHGDAAAMEGMMQAVPIPGQGMTQDPEQKLPYERAPEFTDLQEYLEDLFLVLTEPEKLEGLFEIMATDLPLENIAEKLLMNSFKKGEINPDMLMLAIEPVIYMLISLATYGGVDVTLYPEDPMQDSDVSDEDLFKRASRELLASEDTNKDGSVTVDEVQAPATLPKSLLARAEKAVASVQGKEGNI